MRRENRRRNETEGLDTKKTIYIIGVILSLAVIAFVITFIAYGNALSESTKQIGTLTPNTSISNTYSNDIIKETSTSYGKTVEEVQKETDALTSEDETSSEDSTQKVAINTSNIVNDKKETSNTTTSDNTTSKQNTSETTEKVEPIADPIFKMPVEGDIIKEFANNKLVYSSTLDVWTTHNGIDIAADKTTVVNASAEGTVASIKNDPRYGLTIIIEHVNGYKTVYANLLSTEFVVEGEKVEQGQSIGTVGNTATFEISEQPHLHFELLKENEQQDPELYLIKD